MSLIFTTSASGQIKKTVFVSLQSNTLFNCQAAEALRQAARNDSQAARADQEAMRARGKDSEAEAEAFDFLIAVVSLHPTHHQFFHFYFISSRVFNYP